METRVRCQYEERTCGSDTLVCFRCARCGRLFSIEKCALDQMDVASARLPDCAAIFEDPTGAGTKLKKLLSRLKIDVCAACPCNDPARRMNERGVEWCEQNIGEIVGWLKEEAARRKLPFLAMPAKIIVQRAIEMAKRARARRAAR
jgi:hypothetical protein